MNDTAVSGANNLQSHESTAALTFQLREDLFCTGRYRRYWNNADMVANGYSFETFWEINQRFSVVGGYQFQQFESSGPDNHGIRAGISIGF